MCAVLSRSVMSQLFVTSWTVAHQAPLFMGFSRQEYWSGLPCPPPGHLPNPGLLHCRRILYRLSHQGRAARPVDHSHRACALEPAGNCRPPCCGHWDPSVFCKRETAAVRSAYTTARERLNSPSARESLSAATKTQCSHKEGKASLALCPNTLMATSPQTLSLARLSCS